MTEHLKRLLISASVLLGCVQFAFSQDIQATEPIVETGLASWYGSGFQADTTAGGEVFDMAELTAAHPTLPFDTRVRVTNLKNKKSVVVRINDRGPFIRERVIDLSMEAARQLGFIHAGVVQVKVEVID